MSKVIRLRRGFKKESEQIACELRSALGLTVYDPLDYFRLAAYLQVDVRSLDEMQAAGLSLESLTILTDPTTRFSAVMVCHSDRYLIVYNAAHSAARMANDVTHELSHKIHAHPPRPAISYGGCREWDDCYEAEADWQAGALLVPRDGALACMRRGGSIATGASQFGVSEELFRWRVNMTGVMYQLGRARRRAGYPRRYG